MKLKLLATSYHQAKTISHMVLSKFQIISYMILQLITSYIVFR